MRSSLALAFGLVTLANAQTLSQWYDSISGVTFWRYYVQDIDTSFGYVFPPLTSGQPTPDDFIGIFQGPADGGWIGNSLGGAMRANPLLVGWTDGSSPKISARWADGYSPPAIYSGPRLTILGSSGSNGVYQRIVYRCQNCTTWTGGSNGISLNGTQPLGWAFHSSQKPLTPSDPTSGLYRHSHAGQYSFDVGAARTASYNSFLQTLTNAPPLTAPTTPPTTSLPPSTTSAPPTPSTTFVSCPGAPQARYGMNIASGFRVAPLLGSLTMPRGIALDTRGNLLVVERGKGLSGHTLDANGCVSSTKLVIQDTQINHGIDVHPAGNRIIASSGDIAWSWDYDPVTMTATNKRTLVTGMNNFYHFTRTVLISRKNPNLFALNVGSDGNIDLPTRQASAGRAQIRVFDYDTLPAQGASYTSSYGRVLGYGLRNDVGIAQDRAGNFHSIENSLDDAYRMINGQRRDIHIDNPAEKVYNLGDPANPRGIFGGYPDCFTVWEPRDFTDSPKQVGDWFTQDNSGQYTDAWCNSNAVKPTLLLPPHTAPLDMKFGIGNDTNLYVALHGSWNRQPPQGYKVVVVPGQYSASGEWSPSVPLAQTKTSWTNLLTNLNENQCSGFGNANCFRPVGLVWSANGENLYVTSDTSGEVFIVKRMSGPVTQPPVSQTTTSQPISTTQPPSTTTQPPSTTQPPTTVAPPQPTQTLWGQCGGQGWTGPTACSAGSVCRASNQWYSQCVPA